MKLVVDTSVVLKWFVHAEDEYEEALWYSFVAEDLIVPDLVYAETASALSRKVERGEVDDAQARAVLENLSSYFSESISCSQLAHSAYELSQTLMHPIYDCFFLAATVKADGRQLLTADWDFVRKVIGGGFGEYTRVIGRRAVSVDTLGGLPSDLDLFVEKMGEVENQISRQLQGSPVILLTEKICNLPEFEPGTERSRYKKFKKKLSEVDGDALRKVISVCWYGRPLAADSFKQMHHDAGELTHDPERHAFYIASLLPYFQRGIERLMAVN